MLAEAWPATVRLVGISLVLSYLAGIAIGVVQAVRGGALDTVLSVVSVTLFALPGYWLGLMLVMLFTYKLRILPAFGSSGFDADFLTGWQRAADWLRHLALPLATLTIVGVGGAARFVRGAMLDVAGEPYVAIARAKGITELQVALHHMLRNALIPVLTLLGLSLPALFSGAVFIEAIFAWPGVGRILVEAVQARDYPVVMAATAVSAVLVVAGNLLADFLTTLANPRVRSAISGGSSTIPVQSWAPPYWRCACSPRSWRHCLPETPISSGTSSPPGFFLRSASTITEYFIWSGPIASAATSGPGSSWARGCRSASVRSRQ